MGRLFYDVVIDSRTGDVRTQAIEIGDGPVDLESMMERIEHDCPLCQEALARGEKPVRLGPAEIEAMLRDRDGWQGRRRKRRRGRR